MVWLLLVNLLVLFIGLRGICYAADRIELLRNQTEQLRGEMIDVMKDVLENNKRASNDVKALLEFYEQVCEECKKGDTK